MMLLFCELLVMKLDRMSQNLTCWDHHYPIHARGGDQQDKQGLLVKTYEIDGENKAFQVLTSDCVKNTIFLRK